MQLVILIMVNILIASIFYLIISLKLERSATEFRSKRLRKEMEDLINEFNHTAERNLALLEYKINILRELLKRADALPGLDITINDESQIKPGSKKSRKKINRNEENIFAEHIQDKEDIQTILTDPLFDISKKTGKELHDNAIVYLEREKTQQFSENKSQVPTITQQLSEIARVVLHKFSQYIESRYTKKANINIPVHPEDVSHSVIEEYDTSQAKCDEKLADVVIPADEEELITLYNNADDKYLMIATLYSQGYPLQVLSKISGIPIGEISLILNLSMKK
ncbi:MAG TPA: hypothetical protein PL059_05520 [Spirochaetota bacterium]|nr:hypothetical protein [Spirochaetota bacterium]HOM10426.1 hypothetical protein [Spirochaetota bacterium]HPP49100.1 hypothetical protein [Spirochaetota bacterium]